MMQESLRNKLSVILITFNEERNIQRCLKSVLSVADEIIIVDSSSTDKTPEICKKFPVRFYNTTWMGYSATKNYANSWATYDYIFSIDADECLSDELVQDILEAKKNGFSGAYKMNRLTNYCGHWIKHTSWYPDTKLRIWNRKNGEWKGEIHEEIVFTNAPFISHLKGDLFHYSYYSIEEHLAQTHKFTALSAQEMFNNGKKFKLYKMLLSPIARFTKDYIIHAGFLDGSFGFTVSRINAYAAFLKYYKLKKLYA